MIRNGILAAAVGLFCLVFNQPLAAQPKKASVDSLAHAFLQKNKATGLAIGIVQGDSIKYFCYGTFGKTDTQTIKPLSVFEIGSITKTFTATMLARLQVAGRVKYGDSLSQYLPAGSIAPAYQGREIKLYQLAQHTAALPRLGENMAFRAMLSMSNPYVEYNAKDLMGDISKRKLKYAPGTRYDYSNFGAGLLGYLLTQREQRSYPQLVDSLITRPLGMHTIQPGTEAGLVKGHDEKGKETHHWDFKDASAGAGAIRANLEDMCRYLSAQIHPESIQDSLLRKAVRETQAYDKVAVNEKMKIALAWHIMPLNGQDVYWHNGGTGGFRSFIGYMPGNKGIVVLGNAADSVDPLAVEIFKRMVEK